MPKIKLVIFDVNETLFSFDELEKRFKKVGLDSYYCKLWFSNVLKEGFALNSIKKFVPFRVIGENQIMKMLEKKKIKKIKTNSSFILEGFKKLRAHEDVKEAFENLKKKKIKIATLTNGHSEITKIQLKKNKLSRFVDDCFSVDDVRIWKPTKAPYLKVVEHFNFKKKDVVMVAAHSWDIAGAKDAGLLTGYVSRYEGSFLNYYEKATYSSENLIEMSKLII